MFNRRFSMKILIFKISIFVISFFLENIFYCVFQLNKSALKNEDLTCWPCPDRARLGRVDIFAPFFDSLLRRHLVWIWKIQLSFLTNIMTKDNLFERLYVKQYWMVQRKLGYLITEISWQVGGIFYRESSKTTGFNSGSVLKSLWIERTIPW